jgi:hypothetical protein
MSKVADQAQRLGSYLSGSATNPIAEQHDSVAELLVLDELRADCDTVGEQTRGGTPSSSMRAVSSGSALGFRVSPQSRWRARSASPLASPTDLRRARGNRHEAGLRREASSGGAVAARPGDGASDGARHRVLVRLQRQLAFRPRLRGTHVDDADCMAQVMRCVAATKLRHGIVRERKQLTSQRKVQSLQSHHRRARVTQQHFVTATFCNRSDSRYLQRSG